jgi:hypothetical protein
MSIPEHMTDKDVEHLCDADRPQYISNCCGASCYELGGTLYCKQCKEPCDVDSSIEDLNRELRALLVVLHDTVESSRQVLARLKRITHND